MCRSALTLAALIAIPAHAEARRPPKTQLADRCALFYPGSIEIGIGRFLRPEKPVQDRDGFMRVAYETDHGSGIQYIRLEPDGVTLRQRDGQYISWRKCR